MQKLSKALRDYALKLTQAADLIDDLADAQPVAAQPARRKLSAASRHKIAVAQRKRWKLYHGKKAA